MAFRGVIVALLLGAAAGAKLDAPAANASTHCDTTDDCGTGYRCETGSCIALVDSSTCSTTQDCMEGYRCDASYMCVSMDVSADDDDSCDTDSDCDTGYRCSSDHLCTAFSTEFASASASESASSESLLHSTPVLGAAALVLAVGGVALARRTKRSTYSAVPTHEPIV